MVKPKKYLGQHFLTDPAIARRIVGLLPGMDELPLLEIGPGTGILTQFLLERKNPGFFAVEIDKESHAHLCMKYPGHSSTFINDDFLKMDLRSIFPGSFSVIGNFPYNISSQIFFRILENRDRVGHVVCMIQKEVADRIISPPGSREYGILSVLLQAYYSVSRGFQVKPGSFFPPPRVTSSVIVLQRNSTVRLACDEKLFLRVVKATFNQRRKTIRNSLKTILLNLEGECELLTRRPEQLSVSEFVQLTNWVEKQVHIVTGQDH